MPQGPKDRRRLNLELGGELIDVRVPDYDLVHEFVQANVVVPAERPVRRTAVLRVIAGPVPLLSD